MARKASADKAATHLRTAILLGALSVGCNGTKPAAAEAGVSPAPQRAPAAAPSGPKPAAAAPPTAPPQPAAPCPAYRNAAAQGTLREPRLAEISGLARSPRQDHFWVHNDSGDEARVYALSPTGVWLATFRLAAVAEPTDIEDIAVVERAGRSHIYLGDIGDNKRLRSHVIVHRFDEPKLSAPSGFASPHREQPTGAVTSVRLTYPDGAHDAEALLVDPRTGSLVIVTKTLFGPPRIYERELFADGPLVFRGEVDETAAGVALSFVTAADVAPRGDYVAVRTYAGAYLFARSAEQSLPAALLGPACTVPTGPEKQGEALALVAGPAEVPSVATIGEGQVTTLWLSVAE